LESRLLNFYSAYLGKREGRGMLGQLLCVNYLLLEGINVSSDVGKRCQTSDFIEDLLYNYEVKNEIEAIIFLAKSMFGIAKALGGIVESLEDRNKLEYEKGSCLSVSLDGSIGVTKE
jgi:hypothetical protein